MKIAMFGGSFDPVHKAHVRLCERMIKDFDLDKVIVFPAASSPFKDTTETSPEHRLNMCRLAFVDIDEVEVSDFEIKRGGKSYTIDTLNFLKSEYPGAELYLIVGGDAFSTLDKWHKAQEIFDLAHILTIVRDSHDLFRLVLKKSEYKKFGAKVDLVDSSVGGISSTKARELLIADDDDITRLLPHCVIDYIKENNLYGYED